MSERKKRASAVPEVSPADVRFQRWLGRAYAFAALCLFTLAAAEAAGFATPLLRTLLMIGLVAAGTGAWAMQAKRKCPQCGKPYGYHLRIVNANVCRHCGADFPRWRPGLAEHEDDKQ